VSSVREGANEEFAGRVDAAEAETRMSPIKTEFVYPPIPIRQFDWRAYLDGGEESGPYGYGVTEEAAVADLREQIAEREG